MLKTFVCCGFALALLGVFAIEAAAQSSCSGWYSKCAGRCKANAPGNPKCASNNCRPKLAECRRTGCWLETPRFGGKNNCNLKKS